MNFFGTALGFIITLQVLVNRNPVPNPGASLSATSMQQQPLQQATLHRFLQHDSQRCQGEGYCGTMPTVGAENWIADFCRSSAKHGQPPPMSNSSSRPAGPHSAVNKRSFKRACRRAIRHGSSHYHGKHMTIHDFPSGLIQRLQKEAQPQHRAPLTFTTSPRDRLTCLHWNPGGLSQSTWLEVKHWLQMNPVDLVVISETRWSFSSTWQDKAWLYVHSATQDHKSGGILIMVSRRIAQPEQIGYNAIVDGRLVHLRVHYDNRALDVLAIYQHVDSRTSLSAQKRAQVWDALHQALQRMPSRNNLICAGDFNCALEEAPPWVGTSKFAWHGRCFGNGHQDHARLRDIMKAHGLTAIDTWGSSGATYIHGDFASRIDHFLIRLLACDGQSKQVQFLYTADFVPANATHHVPILCSIRSKHMAYQTFKSPTSCTYAQRNKCRIAGLQETQEWHSLRQQVVQALQEDHQALTPEARIQKIHDKVSTAFHNFFSPKPNSTSQVNLETVHDTIEDKWHHKRLLRQMANKGLTTVRILLQAWHHRSRYQALQRAQQRATRQARRDRFQALCHEVANAAQLHDTHSMFGIINRFSPKKPLARARLRGPDGNIADQFMAHSLTVAFVQSMWQGPPKLPIYHDAAPGIPFDLDELVTAAAKLHTNKSVAQPFLPGVVWRCASLEVASFIYSQLQHWWFQSPPIIPQNWKDSWLFFLPKPGKPNTHPDQLRPISLMEPLGKIVMGLLTTKIKDCIFPELCRMPQFGFLTLPSCN